MLYLKEANFDDIEKEYLFVSSEPVDENGSGHVGQFIHRDFRGREILRQSPWSVSVSVHPLRI